MKVQGEDPATPGCQKETGWGFTPAILNRGCVKPWLALLKTRERKLIPQYRDIKQSNTHRDGGEQTTWIKQSLPQRCVCVGCQLNSDQALRLPCLKGQVSYAVTFRWQEASEFLCTKTPLFWRELATKKIASNPRKCFSDALLMSRIQNYAADAAKTKSSNRASRGFH